ncbi:MAG: hypothetical protein ACJ8FY_04200 [Gemmataceae bacterium]
MKTHFLRGSKQEIVQGLVRIPGEVREAIVFEEEPKAEDAIEDIFAEMQPYEAQGHTEVDDSREAIYTRM